MAETVGNQNRINRALAARVGEVGANIVASAASPTIPQGVGYVEVTTTATATDGVRLPDAPIGFHVTVINPHASQTFKLRATGAGVASGKINNVDCSGNAPAGAGAAIPAASSARCQRTSVGWTVQTATLVGAAGTTLVPS